MIWSYHPAFVRQACVYMQWNPTFRTVNVRTLIAFVCAFVFAVAFAVAFVFAVAFSVAPCFCCACCFCCCVFFCFSCHVAFCLCFCFPVAVFCLCFGFEHITRITPFLLITRQSLHIFFTDGRTFIFFLF